MWVEPDDFGTISPVSVVLLSHTHTVTNQHKMASKLDQNIYDVVTSSPHDMRIPARRKDAVYDEVGPGPGSSIPPPTTKPKPKTESKVKQQIARMESEPLNLRPDRPPLLRAGHPVVPKPPLKPSASLPDSVPPQLGQENGATSRSGTTAARSPWK